MIRCEPGAVANRKEFNLTLNKVIPTSKGNFVQNADKSEERIKLYIFLLAKLLCHLPNLA